MNAAKLLSLPILHRAASVVFPATGQHRAPRPAGALVDTEFRYCPRCEVDTAAVVHGDGSHTCTEDHTIVSGDPT